MSADTSEDLSGDTDADPGIDADGDEIPCEDLGYTEDEMSAAADEGVEQAIDTSVLDAVDGSGAELGDLADDLHLSEAEVRGSVRRLEAAGKLKTETTEEGATYVELVGAEGEAKLPLPTKSNGAAKSNGSSNGKSTVPTLTYNADTGEITAGEGVDAEKPTRNLKCILTEADKAQKAVVVANNFKEIEDLEAEAGRIADDLKDLKSKISGLHLDNRRAMRANREGYEYRDVVCYEKKNLVALTMETIRDDTGEVIESRALRMNERQGALWDSPQV
jgi:DNA-binding Lrp family transcriptional regulator